MQPTGTFTAKYSKLPTFTGICSGKLTHVGTRFQCEKWGQGRWIGKTCGVKKANCKIKNEYIIIIYSKRKITVKYIT